MPSTTRDTDRTKPRPRGSVDRLRQPPAITAALARRIWLRAQRLDQAAPFGAGPDATVRAIEHLGYVQIDTINVIERCHHHILWSRIPAYTRADLDHAQSTAKAVFEYWTHALAYVPTRDLAMFLPAMRAYRTNEPSQWFGSVAPADRRKVMALLRREGPQTIRDIEDDVLVEKTHAWASRKPSKKALQLAFFRGDVAIAAREGMLKRYDLFDRHFGFATPPKPATAQQIIDYKLDRALRSQGLVSLDSICHLDAKSKPKVQAAIAARVKRGALVALEFEGVTHWVDPASLDTAGALAAPDLVHILSPFDPLIIQRKRLHRFFGYEHLFEAYVPKEKRRLGYFALPVLADDRIVAALDLKADRQARKLLIQSWTWLPGCETRALRRRIDDALTRLAAFQFGP